MLCPLMQSVCQERSAEGAPLPTVPLCWGCKFSGTCIYTQIGAGVPAALRRFEGGQCVRCETHAEVDPHHVETLARFGINHPQVVAIARMQDVVRRRRGE